jgi:hypothetical protein
MALGQLAWWIAAEIGVTFGIPNIQLMAKM